MLKKKGEDAGNDAGGPAASASAAEAGPAAITPSNDSEVTHYPDQAAANDEALTTHVTAAARTEASMTGGKLVAELHPGTQAQKLADHEGFDLVTFPDPKDATQKLEGWVHASAFGYAPPGPTHAADGGGAPPAACTPKPLDLPQRNGACSAGYGKCSAGCRLECKTAADCCATGASCQGGMCLGPGKKPCG